MKRASFDEQVKGVAALEHPITKRIYEFVVQHDWTSRDQAAATLSLPRSVAAFHLDKLVDAGLLAARFERTTGRTGPGAGRPAKLYGRSDREIDLSLPRRQYELAGRVLADAVVQAETGALPLQEAIAHSARAAGRSIGAAQESNAQAVSGDELLGVLADQGYEPRRLGGVIAMANCPFHALVERHRELVCSMNLQFLTGLLEGRGDAEACTPHLAPEAGYCCVRIAGASNPRTTTHRTQRS
jgi:predicted ArsR family transcriptional regulator